MWTALPQTPAIKGADSDLDPWNMGDSSEKGSPESLETQLLALKSSSTNLRIEALRKLQHAIQDGKANVLHRDYTMTDLQMTRTQRRHQLSCPSCLRPIRDTQIENLVAQCSHASVPISQHPHSVMPSIPQSRNTSSRRVKSLS